MAEVFAQKRPSFATEYRIVRPSDGAVRWMNGLGRLEFDALGNPVKMLGTIQDITERKQVEAALRESEESLREAQRIAGLGSFVLDIPRKEWRVSVELDALLGTDASYDRALDGIWPLIHPDDRAVMKERLKGYFQGENHAFDRQYRIVRHSDGAVRWVHTKGRLELDSRGKLALLRGTVQDITEAKHVEATLRESKELLQLFIEHAPVAIAMLDREMRYLTVSRHWVDVHDLGGRDLIGHSHYEIFPGLPDRWKDQHRRALAGEAVRAGDNVLQRENGSEQWLRRELRPWFTADGETGGIIIFTEDITERKKSEDRQRLAASVFTHATEGIIIADAAGAILEVNDAFTRITGYTRDEVLGRNPRFLKSGLQTKEFYEKMWRSLIESGQWSGEVWNRAKNGDIYPEMLTISAVRDAEGKVQQYVALFSDMTQMKEQQRRLEQIAHFDVLTGLANRALLANRLDQAMARAERRQQMIAIAYLDLDGFKGINDRYGHETGDRLLITLAKRMKRVLREGDTLARLGGDEFVAVLIDLPSVEACEPVFVRLLRAAGREVRFGDLSLRVSASIGVTFYPQQEEIGADHLLRQADQAMYQAKLAGKNRYHRFDPSQDIHIRSRHESLDRVRQALAARQFTLYYQPKVNMRTGETVGAEALIRWQHPEHGLLPPAVFLPLIEDHPLAIELGEWVIESALAQIESWQSAGLHIPVSVNVHALQLQQPDFVDRLRALLAAHPRVAPSSLELEVLETSALQDIALISEVLHACNALGVSIALDDFGTGYSSLSYLKRLPAKILKIDRSFVSDMFDDPESLAILEGVLGLASAFGQQVIAEGVETAEHGSMLLQMGCELAQGYCIARPMPGHDLPRWMTAWRPDPRWVQTPTANNGIRILLYAEIEHRAWMTAFEAFVWGTRPAPPRLNVKQCRLGMWLEAEKLAKRDNLPRFMAVDAAHRSLHEMGAEIAASHVRAGDPESMARLKDLHDLTNVLLTHLAALRE